MSRVAITGARGQLGRQLVEAFRANGDEVLPLSRPQLDLDSPEAAIGLLRDARPEVIVHAAAWTDVDGCARDPEAALRRNGDTPRRLAEATAAWEPLFVQISTNEVFDGTATAPYAEDAAPNPVNPYGASKLAAEEAVREAAPRHLVIRTAWLFGPGGENFVSKILAAATRATQRGEPLRVVDDEWGNPTWAPSLAAAIVTAVRVAPEADVRLLHLAGSPATTRLGWASVALEALGMDRPRIEPISGAAFARDSRVPPRAVLATGLARNLGITPMGWQRETADHARSLTGARATA